MMNLATRSGLRLAALIPFLLLAGCDRGQRHLPPASPPEVLVAAPVRQDVPVVREWLATLDGSANVLVKPRVQGYLTKILYTPGAEVQAGQPMFEIDRRPFEAALAQARADLARYEALQVQAELDAKRQVGLFETKAVSEKDKDAAVQNNEAAKANVLAAKAALDLATLNLEFCTITAPVSGIPGLARPGIGDLVGPSGTEMTTLSTVNPIKASFQISEKQYLLGEEYLNSAIRLPLDQRPAELDLVLGTGEVFKEKGKFLTADRQIDPKTGTLTVEALFPNPGNVLRPGFFARVRAVVRTEKNALLVPQRAVTETQGNYHLVIVGEGEKAEIRPVKMGERIGSLWVVTEGLQPGERVVVEGAQKARPGTVVVPKPFVAPEAAKPAPAPAPEAKPQAK